MDYRVRLSQFEGPLDLLLHLIEKAELDICDVYISEITSQYLSYMSEVDTLDMDTASEFLVIASQLIFTKSKMMLPKPQAEPMSDDDTEMDLIERLAEYKRIKELTGQLYSLHESAKQLLTRPMEEFPLPTPEIIWKGGTYDALYRAYHRILHRNAEPEAAPYVHNVMQDKHTIKDRVLFIREALLRQKEIAFDDLFIDCTSKMTIIVTFMAMLEMAARGELHFAQDKPYASIRICARSLFSEDISAYDDSDGATGGIEA